MSRLAPMNDPKPGIGATHRRRAGTPGPFGRLVQGGLGKTLCWFSTVVWLAPVSLPAQTTNRAVLMKAATVRMTGAAAPVLIRPLTNTPGRAASVEVKLPQDLRRYHVVEQRAQTTRLATNLTTLSTNQVRATLAAGSTLLFMENDAPAPLKANARTATKPLFSTYMLRSTPPARPGEPNRTASGTLTMLADVPTPWDSASNAYVTRLSVMFLTEDAAPTNALLPLAVEFSGGNVKSIQPRKVELRKAGVDGSEEVLVTCDRYRPDVTITAYYQTTNTTRVLTLQRLTPWGMTQMIISAPMLFAALVGGLIGGLLRLFKGGKWKPSRLVHYLIEGGVVGLVTVTMLLSGLLHNQIAGMSASPQLVLAFSLAAAAGSVGAHFLDAAINRLRGRQTA
jgi:hypothetical protein